MPWDLREKTDEELRTGVDHTNHAHGVEAMIRLKEVVERMDRGTTRLTWVMLFLTFVQAVAAVIAVVQVVKGK